MTCNLWVICQVRKFDLNKLIIIFFNMKFKVVLIKKVSIRIWSRLSGWVWVGVGSKLYLGQSIGFFMRSNCSPSLNRTRTIYSDLESDISFIGLNFLDQAASKSESDWIVIPINSNVLPLFYNDSYIWLSAHFQV